MSAADPAPKEPTSFYKIDDSDLVVAAADVVATELGEMLVLLDLSTEQYFSLNATGSIVWRMAEVGRDVASICDEVGERFEVSREECAGDVRALLSELSAAKLVSIVSNANASQNAKGPGA